MSIGSALKYSMVAGVFAMVAPPVTAQEAAIITLKSLDGTVVLTGELQGFDAGYYHLMVTGVGLIRVAEDLVTCQSTSVDCAALVGHS